MSLRFSNNLTCRALLAAAAVFAGLACQPATSLVAQDWPQFRGPEARGIIESPVSPPTTWSESENVAWKTDIAGRGWSSPVVVGNQVFITTVTQETGKPEEAKPGLYFGGDRNKPADIVLSWKVISLNLKTGEQNWEEVLHSGKPVTSRHLKNSYASETPVSDGQQLYVLFGNLGCYCLSLEGDLVWEHKLPANKTRNDWGTAASPVLHQDSLFIVDDNEEQSFLVSLNTKTGEENWRVDRDEKSNWATPFIWQNDLRTEIITPGSGKVRSYDLEGNLLYEFSGCSTITIATPYAVHGLLYVSSGYVGDANRPIFAIRPGASGDITLGENETSNKYIAWCQPEAAPYNPTTLVYQGQLYVLYDRGFFAAYDAVTGEAIYEKERLSGGKSFTSSPWAYDGKVFCLNEFGETLVVQAGPVFEQLESNTLPSEELCMATPAMVGDRLILRTGDSVVCIANE